jgi:hypothetical protein
MGGESALLTDERANMAAIQEEFQKTNGGGAR